jgi:hypothetical protein
MNTWSKNSLSLMLGVVLIAAFFNPVIIPEVTSKSILSPRWVPPKPAHTAILEGQSLEAIHIKFIEGSSFRLRHGEMITLGNDDLAGIQAVLNAYPVRSIERLFSQPEDELSTKKLELEAVSGEQMPDLNLWYRFTVEAGVDPSALIDALNGLPVVETAYPAPLPVPPPSYKSTSTTMTTVQFVDAVTPNYVSQQGYLNPAPGGIEAKYAWTLPGGKGQNVTIVDVEYSFNKNHEDLAWKSIPVITGQLYVYEDHGTAVLGELVSQNNTFGVTGIAHLAKAAVAAPCSSSSNCGSYNPANAINVARTHTVKGDIILIEQQTPVCGLSNYGPLEWYQAVYDAIKTSTADGRIVVEAAGNGGVNLDGTSCNNKFNRKTRDSGAILVGAGATPTSSQADRSRLDFSSYGSRVDLQGWGENIVTTGYGDLYTGTGKNQWYTSSFGGTSGASPIVTGAAAILSSIAQQRGMLKSPAWIRSTLVSTGSPQQAAPGFPITQHIGPRPDLKKAIAKLTPPSKGSVLVDAAHSNFSGINAGYITWKALLQSNGYTVNQLSTGVTPAALSGKKVFVALVPTVYYTASEKSTLMTWVQNGGALLVIGDWYKTNIGYIPDWAIPTNNLSTYFGIKFVKAVCAIDNTNYEINNFWIYLYPRNYKTYANIMNGITRTETFATANLTSTVGSPVIRLDADAVPSSGVVVMARKIGTGRVLVLGDSNFWSDEGAGAKAINAFDNKKFALRAISWLASGTAVGITEFYDILELLDIPLLPPADDPTFGY